MKLFILVSLNLHNTAPSHYINESDSTVISCDHSDVLIKEIDSGHFTTTRKLAIVIFDFNGSLKFKSLHVSFLSLMSLLLNLSKIRRVSHRVHLIVSYKSMTANGELLVIICVLPAKLKINLYTVIIDEANSIDETYNEFVTR